MVTIITPQHLDILVKQSAKAIREFLSTADAKQFKGEAHAAISAFQANPLDFTDEKLVAYGADTIAAINYPVRIEVRGAVREGAAQMVAKGIWGPRRAEAAVELSQECRRRGLCIHLKLAGTSSIEFNIDGVDKSLPIRFLNAAFDHVLKEMKYEPGEYVNSRKSRTVIAADGDGTIYDGPRIGVLPTLAESPVCKPLIAYLKAGGIFMLVSGNDINRTVMRLLDALPTDVYCRVLVAANGGAELVYLSPEGRSVPVSNYRSKALKLTEGRSHAEELDIVYIADDGSSEGNDYPAFKAVGFNRSVLVAPEFLTDYDPALKSTYLGGMLGGTAKFLEQFQQRLKQQ